MSSDISASVWSIRTGPCRPGNWPYRRWGEAVHIEIAAGRASSLFNERDPVRQKLRFDVPENECSNL